MAPESNKKDLNVATEEEIKDIVGCKPSEEIIKIRKKYGLYRSFEDLNIVEGVGKDKIEKLKNNFEIAEPAINSRIILCRELILGEFSPKGKIPKTSYKNLAKSHLHLSINGFKNDFQKLRTFVKDNKPDVVCVTGSNISYKQQQDYNIEGYQQFMTEAINIGAGVAGGVTIYAKTELHSTELKSLEFKTCNCNCKYNACNKSRFGSFENVWIEFKPKTDSPSIVIGAFHKYKASNSHHNKCFNTKLESKLNEIKQDENIFYLMGNFNFDLFEVETEVLRFCETLEKCDCKLLIDTETTTKGELLNHIYTNSVNPIIKTGVVDEKIFKHYPIFYVLP